MARLGGESLEALVDHVRLLGLAEEGDDAGAAEAQIMLERMAGAFDLAPVGAAAQLMRAFEALSETRRAERMAPGKQPARGVGDHLAPIAVVAIVVVSLCAPLGAEPERPRGAEFRGRETLVKSDPHNIAGARAGLPNHRT